MKKNLKFFPRTFAINVNFKVIIFYNEVWGLFLRCLHSIFNRTPGKQIKEIMLVDDGSDDEKSGYPLKNYVKENSGEVVFGFLKNNERQGLIVTRMIGAKAAEGKVIVFLDSHMEVKTSKHFLTLLQ